MSKMPPAIAIKIHTCFVFPEQPCGGSKNTVKDVPDSSDDLTEGRLQVRSAGDVTETLTLLFPVEVELQLGEEIRTSVVGKDDAFNDAGNARYTFPCTSTHPVAVMSGEETEKVVMLRIRVALFSMVTFPSTCTGVSMVKFVVCVTFRSPIIVVRFVGAGDGVGGGAVSSG